MANSAMDKWLKQAQSRKPAEEKQQEDPMDKWLKQAQSRKPVETKPVETAKKPAPVVSSVYKSATWSPTVPMAARNAAMADVNAIFAEKQKQEQQAQQERQAQQETLQKLQKERAEVELTQTRANRSGGVKDKEAQKTLKAREKELEAAIQKGQEALGQQTTAERLGKAGQSIALNTAGSVPLIAETAEQALENTVAYESSELNQKIENALNDVQLAKALHGKDSREYQMASGYLNYLREEAMNFKQTQPGVSKDSLGYQMLDMGQKAREKSLEGLTGSKRILAEQALSLADNAAVLSLGLINPVLPNVVMGAKVNAGKIYDLTNQGVNATSALARGTVSGAIEAATEKMGVDNLFDVVKTGGKTALVNILKQAGVEGTEEGFSYLFNWMADKLAKDPNATFSPAELLANIAGGAVSGLVFGAGGTAINRLGGGRANTMPTYSENGVIKRPIRQTGKALQAPAESSVHLEDGPVQGKPEVVDRLQVVRNGQRVDDATQRVTNTAERVSNVNENVDEIPKNVIEGGKLNAGADLSDAQQQRSNGAGAGEQAGSLGAGAAGSAAQSQTDAGGRAKEARDLADVLQVAPQNSRSLGLVRGTEDNTVRMIPREQQTEYMTEVANRVRQETGKEVDFFVGELRVKSSNARGYTVANGCIMPDGRIYVQADNDTLTAEQIAMHEAAHDLIDQNGGMMAQTIQQVQERYGNEALEAMVEDYLRNLRGLDMDANSCMEEILCDAFAGINAFDAQADVLQEDVQRSFTEYRAGSSQQERGTAYQRGPPAEQTAPAAEQTAPAAEQKTGKAAQDAMPAETARPVRETNVTRDEETSETERPAETLSAAEKAKRELLDALNAGEITEEDFDAAWADIMSEPEMQDRERLSVTEQDERVREQTERFQRGEITADELRGYLNGMQAGQENKNTTREGGVERYSINESFAADIDRWDRDGRPDGETFILGSTGPVLQGLGAMENDIYMMGDKIKTILEEHPEMTLEEIKKIPQLLEDPVMILASKGVGKQGSNTRLVIYGSVKAQNKQPVMSVLDLRPVEDGLTIDDMQKVNSAYAKKNPVNFVTTSQVLHADEKRTIPLLKSMGLQLRPNELLRSGSMGSISYFKRSVKFSGVPFSDVVKVEQTESDVNSQKSKKLPVKERLSITEPVERTKDLLAIHNKDWNYIRDAVLDWGGIPSPSVAIVDAQEGHTKYGDTSVIYPSSAIDPQLDKRNKVYGSDAWTPTHSSARVEYEVDYDVKRTFDRRIEELSKNVANGVFARSSVLGSSGVEDVTAKTTKELAQQLASNYEAVQAAYLAERGEDVPVVYREKVFDSYGNDVLKVFVNQVGVQELANMAVRMELGERLTTQEVEAAREVIVNDWVNKNEWRLKQKPELRKNRIDKRREQIGDIRAEDFIRHAWELYENTGAASDEVDKLATADNLRQAVNIKDVEEWVEQQLQGLLGKPGIYNNKDVFDSRGNRRSFAETHWDYTAENIVRAMNNASDRGEGLWGMSGSGLVAMATPEYGSIEAIHGDESRLRQVEKAEYDQMVQDLDAELDRVTENIMRTTEHHTDNSFEERDIIGHVIAEAAGKKQTVRNVKAVFAKNGYAITDQQAANVIKLLEHAGKIPAGYFEAKPKRVVGFDEALAVIAPSYVPIEELDAVRNAGVNVLLYEAGNDQQRMEIANSLEGAKFSVTEADADEDAGEIKLETVAEEEHRKMLDGLTTKERNYLQRVERRAVNQIAKALGVPYHAKREYLMPMVQELATEYMTAGEISEGTKDAVFEKAWDEGIEVDNEFYNAYKPLKDRLRNTAVMLAEQDRADIPDWNNARKNMFGVLRIVNQGGMTVDQFYEELASDYPGMFPTDIRHPADRLQRMYEVGRDIRIANLGLEQYYGPNAERYKAFARGEFENNLGEVLAEMRNVKRSAAERAEREQIKVPETPKEIMELYKDMKTSKREYEKVNAKQLLSDTDRELLNRAMRGEVNLDNIVDDGRYNLQGVKAVYAAKQVYEQQARVIRDYNRKRKAGLRNQADEYLKNAGSWKDKRAGILYSRETQERNVYDIVKNKAEAKALIAEYFAPVHRHEADAIKLKNELRDKVRELDLSRKVQKGNLVSEAHAVQLLGEAEDNIRMLQTNKRMKTRDGKTLQEWEAIVENLWKESPKLDQQKIRNGVQAFREMYDDLFQRMNEVRVRNGYEPINFRSGYFPHFQAEADGILAAFGKAMGINTAVEALPTSINGLTRNFKPGIRWVGNTQTRLGFDTTYDAVEGFDRYIEGVADVIYHTDDIQKLRALSAQVRYRTTDEGIRERVDQVRADSTLTDQDKETLINSIYANGRFELGNYAVNLDEYTNLLANKKSESDRNMERQVGRQMYKITKTLEGRVAANMVAVNPASWLTNFIPITQGGAQLGPTQMLHGMWNTLVSMKTDDGVVGRSSFLTNRQGSDSLVLSRGQTWSATASAPMGWIDNFTAGSLVRARYEQNLKRGLSEQAALEEADEWAAGVMADRSKGSMPTLFHASNPVTKLFTQFQLEVNNQLSYLFKDIPREELEKGVAHLIKAYLKFFVGAWMYNEVYEYFIGRRPALDPIGILDEFSGDLTGWEIPNAVELIKGLFTGDMPSFQSEKEDFSDALFSLGENVLGELPFTSVANLLGLEIDGGRFAVASAIPDVTKMIDTWDKGTSKERRRSVHAKELLKPVSYILPSFGGGQLKKAIEAIDAYRAGGSYTVNAQGEQQLQYPVYNEGWEGVLNLAKAAVFGKTTLETGREWIENDFKTFSVNETAAYNAMVETGLQGEEAYNLLLNLRAAQKTETESAEKHKQRVLLESDIPADAKAAVYYAMFASEDEQLLMNVIMATQGDGGAVADTLMRMKFCETSNDKRQVLIDSAMEEWEKKRIYQEKISDTRDDDIELFRKAGMDMDDFLEVQNKYTEINGTEGAKAGDKAVALSRWLNGRNYSAEQKETIKEVFKFFSQIPAEAEKYDSFTAMGMSDDEAFRLTDELSTLQPEEGKKQVSNLQKWQTVVGAGLSKDKQLAALEEVMSETEYLKLNIGNGYGIDPQTYVKFKAALQTHDANGNGSYSQDEIRAAIDGMSGADEEAAFMAMLLGESVDAVFLTTEQKAVLWQLQSSSDSAKNNPYSRSVGEKVLQLKNAEDSPVAESEAALLAMLGLN